MPNKDKNSARYAYSGLDRTIHEKARLSIITSLMTHPDGLAFADLKRLCDLTDGNLSRHIKVLQTAKLIAVTKGYEGNRPHTSCKITALGQKQFLEYIAVLEQVVKDAAPIDEQVIPSSPLPSPMPKTT